MMAARQALRIVAEALQPAAGGPSAAARRQSVRDWTRPLALANAHLVSPAMYASLAGANALASIPNDTREYLALLYGLNRDRNRALRRQAIELLAALNAAGIYPLLLKGALSLFGGLYPDVAARMIRDLDILVPAAQLGDATRTLGSLGYAVIARYEAGHNAYGDFARPHDPGAVDVHLELVETPYLLPATEVWARAKPKEAAPGAVFFVPSPSDAALHHLLHAQVHHRANFYRGVLELRQLHEFALLIERCADVDWEAIQTRLAAHRLDLVLESYALAAQRLFDCGWPLPQPPSSRAIAQCRRGFIRLCWPMLAMIAAPLANVRSAFAWHRMQHLYAAGSLMGCRLQHAVQFMRKTAARDAVGRLFRAH
ncbi:MAG TPA: nucleotidyltransferase family protein [Alphaproteobacteria bacterium]|nr:nucleotidyltransferase family protein [Alphaproteobacteria bacterium]